MIIQVFNIVVSPVEVQLGHIYDFLSLCLHVQYICIYQRWRFFPQFDFILCNSSACAAFQTCITPREMCGGFKSYVPTPNPQNGEIMRHSVVQREA